MFVIRCTEEQREEIMGNDAERWNPNRHCSTLTCYKGSGCDGFPFKKLAGTTYPRRFKPCCHGGCEKGSGTGRKCSGAHWCES